MGKKKAEKKEIIGTTIKMTELEKKFLNNFVEQRANAEQAFETASRNIRISIKNLWDSIDDFYPELENYRSIYNSLTGELEVIGKKRKKSAPYLDE